MFCCLHLKWCVSQYNNNNNNNRLRNVYVIYGSRNAIRNVQTQLKSTVVPQLKKCQSRVFVIFISKNLSTNLCHHLRRVNVRYQGEISLHFDLPRLYGSRTRSPLLWAVIRILYLDTARFIKLLYVRSPF